MTKERATRQAQHLANQHGLTLVVAHNPYGEESDAENFGYYPKGAVKIFKYETVVSTITPKKRNAEA